MTNLRNLSIETDRAVLAKQLIDPFPIDDFLFDEFFLESLQLGHIVLEHSNSLIVTVPDDEVNLVIHHGRSLLRHAAVIKKVLTKSIGGHHLASNLVHEGIVGGGTRGDLVLSIDDLLRSTTTESHLDLGQEVLLRVHRRVSILLIGLEEGDTTRSTSGNDGDFAYRIIVGDEDTHDGVSSLVVRHEFLLAEGELYITLSTHYNTLIDILHDVIRDHTLTITDSADGTLVHEVRKVSTRETRGLLGDVPKVNILREVLVPRVDTEDLLTTLNTGKSNLNFAVETAWTEESVIEDVDAVRRSDDHDTSLIVETIHLSEELVDGLFTLIVGRHTTCRTLLTNSVNLIDEDDTRLILSCLLEKFAYALGSNTYEHLNEVRGRTLNEGDVGLTSDGSSEEGLTRTWSTGEEGTTRNLGTTSIVAFRFLEEIHNLLEFLFGRVDTLNISESCLNLLVHRKLCGLPKGIRHSHTTPTTSTKQSS